MTTISSKLVGSFLIRTKNPNRKLWFHRFLVLLLTFLVYTIYHMSRKPMSVVKSRLFNGNISDTSHNWAPFDGSNANDLLSLLDGAYWGTYAFGMFFTGYIAERSNLRYYLTTSMSLCGIMCIVSGMAFYLQIHSLYFFLVTQIMTGLVEATGWPAVLAIIGGWFGSTKKGFIFGVWSLHTSAGNMLGTAVSGVFVDHDWGLSFIVPGIVCIIFAMVIFILLVPKPGDVDLKVDMTIPEEDQTLKLSDEESSPMEEPTKDDGNTNNNKDRKEQAINLWDALTIPGVIEFSICLFFTKSVSYIFLNWLPKFISSSNKIPSSQSAYISIMFDIGGSVGSILAGLMADFTNAGAITCIVFQLMAIPSLFLLGHFSYVNLGINLTLLFLAGFFTNGPYSLITTAVSANLACKVPSKAATATVSAIIDGTGSIGAAIGPTITGPLSDRFHWDSVFYLCMLGDFISALCLFRVGLEELNFKSWWHRFSNIRQKSESESSSENSSLNKKTIVHQIP